MEDQYINMKTKNSLLLFFLLAAVTAANINSDSYIDLAPNGYAFSFSNAQGPVQLTITGLPQGLAVYNYTVTPVGPVQAGQYILSVKASDNAGKDEKILIMNVDSAFNTFTAPSATPSPPTAPAAKPSVQVEAASSATTSFTTNISSISALFQSDSSEQVEGTSASSVDSLQSYFNNIDTSSGQGQAAPNIGNSLSQILTDFSNATTSSYNQTSVASVSAQTIVSQNSISLNFNNSQRSTVSTDEANRLFERQKQASGWVAGNYSIVLQLTADKSTLNVVIANLTEKYQVDQQAQKEVAAEMNAVANNKSKIQSAIGNLNGLLVTLNTQITASSSKLTQLQTQKQALSTQVSQTQSSSQQISQSIQSINSQIQSTNASLASNSKTCDSYNSNLLQANKSLNIYNSQLSFMNQQLASAANDIANKKAVVDDLMRQLALAQQQLQLAQDNSNNLTAQKTQLQQNLTATGNSIVSISQSLNSCTAQSSAIKQTLLSQQANLTSLQSTLAQYVNQNNSQSSQIASYQSLIAQETANYNNLQNQSTSAGAALALLKTALPSVTASLATLTSAKNQADLKLQDDLASLQAAIASFKNESANLEMATMTLQNARALSQQADQAVNIMLAQRGNILPFAVAVNSSSSALMGQTIVSPSVNISNWFNYLSANFGTAAFPYQASHVQCLYPFSLSTLNLRNNIPCPATTDPLQTITGKVVKITSFNEVVVAIDASSSQETVEIPSCATLNSNVGGYKVSVGDSALVKGSSQGGNVIVASSIVFLRQ